MYVMRKIIYTVLANALKSTKMAEVKVRKEIDDLRPWRPPQHFPFLWIWNVSADALFSQWFNILFPQDIVHWYYIIMIKIYDSSCGKHPLPHPWRHDCGLPKSCGCPCRKKRKRVGCSCPLCEGSSYPWITIKCVSKRGVGKRSTPARKICDV